MGLVEKLKDALVARTEEGIRYECANCGERFDQSRAECPVCGSEEIVEQEGFEFRPQT